jgi:hypothetical protein
MIGEKIPELKSLSPEEKLILVGELWDEFAGLIRTLSRHGRITSRFSESAWSITDSTRKT